MTDHPSDRLCYCKDIVREQNARFGWELSPVEQHHYAEEIVRYMPANCSPFMLRSMIQRYHAEHAFVAALADAAHPRHGEAWNHIIAHTQAILRKHDVPWQCDLAWEVHDFVQVACMELMRALPTFAYRSRFSTWYYRVIIQRAQRQVRASTAQKRNNGQPDQSLEQCTTLPDQDGAAQVAEQVTAQAFQSRVHEILAERADRRLAHIFYLWAVLDKHVDDIGAVVDLHPSRIRQLLKLARQMLAAHPEIVAWQHPDDTPM